MSDLFFEVGEPYSSLDPSLLRYDQTRQLLQVCVDHPDFEILYLVKIPRHTDKYAEAIIVRCGDGTVSNDNSLGIFVMETLAIVFDPNSRFGIPYEAWVLRRDFPKTLHLNGTAPDEPASLCLYADSWEVVERMWTPKKFLLRILWWLREISNHTLHLTDLAPERLFYSSRLQVVLPLDF